MEILSFVKQICIRPVFHLLRVIDTALGHCDEPEETGTKSSEETPTETDAPECEPHGDHWHCPSGVPEPTSPPEPSADITSKTASSTPETKSTASASLAATTTTSEQFQGGALRVEGMWSSAFSIVIGLIIPVVF